MDIAMTELLAGGEPGDDLVPLVEARALSGLSEKTLRARIHAAGVRVYRDGLDYRRRRVARGDLARLVEPQPIGDAPRITHDAAAG